MSVAARASWDLCGGEQNLRWLSTPLSIRIPAKAFSVA
jgi:hypothetical protein